MKKIISIHCLSFLFCGGLAFAADSAFDRKDMSVRLGMKPGFIFFTRYQLLLCLNFLVKTLLLDWCTAQVI